jgi:hypothetical protein
LLALQSSGWPLTLEQSQAKAERHAFKKKIKLCEEQLLKEQAKLEQVSFCLHLDGEYLVSRYSTLTPLSLAGRDPIPSGSRDLCKDPEGREDVQHQSRDSNDLANGLMALLLG